MTRIPPELWPTLGFWRQQHAEFERLTAIEYPDYPLARDETERAKQYYSDPRTEHLWTFWLQAYHAGKEYLLIERPDGPDEA